MSSRPKRFLLRRMLAGMYAGSCTALLLYAVLTAVPRLAGIEPYRVTSGSMEPAVRNGSLIYVNAKDRMPEIGKIMMISTSDQTGAANVVHRVYEIFDTGEIQMKGDANQVPDPNRITPSQIVGSVVMSIPHIGRWADPYEFAVVLLTVTAASAVGSAVFGMHHSKGGGKES